MKKVNAKKIIAGIASLIVALYLIFILSIYFIQEGFIFEPEKLAVDYEFNFEQNFEEIFIETSDNKKLNALLFKTENPIGLVFYLHGNNTSLERWGKIAQYYTPLDHDIFILDYRGYGKSEGRITHQNQLFEDNQLAYDLMKQRYSEEDITIIGYSIGSGLATYLASQNNPRQLILQSPYYSLLQAMKGNVPLLPSFIIKYKLDTYKYIQDVSAPIHIFHGDEDARFDLTHPERLSQYFKPGDTFTILEDQEHGFMNRNTQYHKKLKDILAR